MVKNDKKIAEPQEKLSNVSWIYKFIYNTYDVLWWQWWQYL